MMTKLRRFGATLALLATSTFGGAVGPLLIAKAMAQFSAQTGLLVSGLGTTVFNYLPLASGQIAVGAGVSNNPSAVTVSGDCTLSGSGVIVCTKTNGTGLGTAATANTGASGNA